MSILIKGMEMPKNCDRCFFCHYIHADEDHEHFYVCSLENWKKPITHLPINPIQAKSKPDWCPLIELPPHGRLIDADALIADCQLAQKQADRHGREFANAFYSGGGEVSTEWWCVEDMIDNAPTIIPADKEGEG